jgi:hypothetical protein
MRNHYLRTNRLEDVIFLLQHLGLGEHYALEEDTIPEGVRPRSARDRKWASVGRQHPEFFLVTDRNTVRLALRYYQGMGEGNRLALEVDKVQQLVQTAISLQEQQAKRAEVWKIWATLVAALVAAVSGVAQLFIGVK